MLSQSQVFELCGQFAALHDGALDEADARTLEQLLRTDREVRRLYVRYMRLCAVWRGTFKGHRLSMRGNTAAKRSCARIRAGPALSKWLGPKLALLCPQEAAAVSFRCRRRLPRASPAGDLPRRGGRAGAAGRPGAVQSIGGTWLRTAIRAREKVAPGSPVAKTRFNAALACIASLLFAAIVAGTGAIISAIFMRHPLEQPEAGEIPSFSGRWTEGESRRRALPAPSIANGPMNPAVRNWVKASSPAASWCSSQGWRRSSLAAAETVLEGPATLEIRYPASIALDRGKWRR